MPVTQDQYYSINWWPCSAVQHLPCGAYPFLPLFYPQYHHFHYPCFAEMDRLVILTIAIPLTIASHQWPSGYNRSVVIFPDKTRFSDCRQLPHISFLFNRMSRRTSWGRSNFGESISRQPTPQYSRQTFSPANQYSTNQRKSTLSANQYSTNQIPQQSYSSQTSPKFSRQLSNSISYNFPSNPNWKRKRFPSYVDRCGS